MKPETTCPLCLASESTLFHKGRKRPYFRCPGCKLVYVPAEFWAAAADARKRYDLHQNRPDDPGYRRFLDRLLAPLAGRLPAGARGLDFGSGPGPTLSAMLEERGFPTVDYDPLYADEPERLEQTYDFVTCSEVAEHFEDPAKDWARLFRLVRPGGWLGVMTELLREDTDFGRWHYRRDFTHVAFYTRETMEWLAGRYGATAQFEGGTVVLFERV